MKPYSVYPDKCFFDKYFELEKETGSLFYKHRPSTWFGSADVYKAWNSRCAGQQAGAVNGGRGVTVCVNKKLYSKHRVILVMTDWSPALLSRCVVNHIDGDLLNDRPENLSLTPSSCHQKENLTASASYLSEKYSSKEFPFWEYIKYDPLNGGMALSERCPQDVGGFIRIGRAVSHGYRVVETRSKIKQVVLAHRLAWRIHFLEWPEGSIDHIDGNPSNNRIANLRLVSAAINMKNKSIYKKNKSGISGVRYEQARGRWVVSLGRVKLGRFADKFEACCVRMSAKARDSQYTLRHGV